MIYIFLLFIPVTSLANIETHPKANTDFWVDNYTLVNEYDTKNIQKTYQIFEAINNVAGNHPGKFPKLIVIEEDPYNTALPVALHDGGIIISKSIIDSIFSTQKYPESYLAFILGHELAHTYSQSYIHIKFFMALENNYKNISELSSNKSEIIKHELYADEQGIMFSVLAGYNPQHILNIKNKYSLLSAWNNSLSLIKTSKIKPLVDERQRQIVITNRLNQMFDKAELYNIGVAYLLSGNYSDAISFFERLKQYYPSREVFHNLAMSYHFLAYQQYTPRPVNKPQLPFKYSYIIDPHARILNMSVRSFQLNKTSQYESLIRYAIHNYKQSLKIDPNYLPTYINLSSAYIADKDNIYKGIALLMDATKRFKSNKILNNLGIAFMRQGDLKKSDNIFKKITAESNYPDALYNYAILNLHMDKIDEAKILWETYNRIRKADSYSQLLANEFNITITKDDNFYFIESKISDFNIHAPLNIPSILVEKHKKYIIRRQTHHYVRLKNGIETILYNGRINLLIANQTYKGKTSQAIEIGDEKESIKDKYGSPTTTISTPSGMIYNYQRNKIAFFISNNKVNGWIIY